MKLSVSLILVGALAASVDAVEDEPRPERRGLRDPRALFRQELADLYASEYRKKKVVERALGDWDDDWDGTSKSTKTTKSTKTSKASKSSSTKSSKSEDDGWHRALGDWDDDWGGTSKSTKTTKSTKSTTAKSTKSTKSSKSSSHSGEWVRG
ncbi:hypothetical protein ACHAXT_009134 [Thalassiosira profunda]